MMLRLLLATFVFLIAGCSANPVTVALTKAVNMGADLPPDMVNAPATKRLTAL